MEYIKLSIKETCKKLNNDGISHENIGKLIGVSRLQVGNYISGKTVNPKPQVCLKVLENIIIENKKVLTGPYVDEDHLRNTIKMISHA